MSSTCTSCRARIFFAPTPSGAQMPLDADPTTDGTVALDRQGHAIVNPGPDADVGTARYRPHWSTCPNAKQHRRARGRR